MQSEIHPAAQRELEEAFEYYFRIDPELAFSFRQHYERCRSQIEAAPLLFNMRPDRVRRVNLAPRFGEYYMAYFGWNEKVLIVALTHAKRRPGYWRSRVREAKEMF